MRDSGFGLRLTLSDVLGRMTTPRALRGVLPGCGQSRYHSDRFERSEDSEQVWRGP
jgi:hypothetical protein